MKFAIHGINNPDMKKYNDHILEISYILNHLSESESRGYKNLKKQIADGLAKKGWSGKISLSSRVKSSVPAAKGAVVISFQFGNMARIYADLIKMQYLISTGVTTLIIYIIPDKELAIKIGQNIANSNRLLRELPLYKSFINMPMVIFSINSKLHGGRNVGQD